MLRRNIVRRDKAFSFLEKLKGAEENHPVNVEKVLCFILKDIPSQAFQKKMSPEWETIALVCEAAALVGLGGPSLTEVHLYIPSDLQGFASKWLQLQSKRNVSLTDYFNLWENYEHV